MGTAFEKIYDRALTTIEDYHLNKIAQLNYQAFLKYWEGILIVSIPYFEKCKNDLSYDRASKSFNSDLTEKEINILSEIMVMNWFSGKVQDVTQFEVGLTNREYKKFSEAQNLKVKSEYLDKLREKYQQDIMEYSLNKNNFASIFNITLT